jgi:hypothetical protein
MMLLPYLQEQQDSVKVKINPIRDSVSHISDSVSLSSIIQQKDSVSHISDSASLSSIIQQKDSVPRRIKISAVRPVIEITDTISVSTRNSIADVTFYDSTSIIHSIGPSPLNKFPFLFLENNRHIQEGARAALVKQLRAGDEIPARQFHNDWIILIILCAAFMFAIVRKSTDTLFQSMERFFLFRGVNNPPARDMGGLFTWESTIRNLISFLILGLFGYSAASFLNLIPSSTNGIIFWIISVSAVIGAVTLRHLLCLLTGEVSGEREVFTEYQLSIYQFYRFSALFIFVVTILISYTKIFPAKSYFIAGATVLATLYLIRVIRLFIIFINKNISLFYLILYLCALEILPVLISVKYITGLA